MSIDYRKWLICALIGLAAPFSSDWLAVMPDHGCSVAEQVQVDAWEAKVKDAKTENFQIGLETLLTARRPKCLSVQDQSLLVNRLPEVARLIARVSFFYSVLIMLLIGGVVWPVTHGIGLLVNAAGRYITRRGRQNND